MPVSERRYSPKVTDNCNFRSTRNVPMGHGVNHSANQMLNLTYDL